MHIHLFSLKSALYNEDKIIVFSNRAACNRTLQNEFSVKEKGKLMILTIAFLYDY